VIVEVVDTCWRIGVRICVEDDLVLKEVPVSAWWSKGSFCCILHKLSWSHRGPGRACVFHRVYRCCL